MIQSLKELRVGRAFQELTDTNSQGQEGDGPGGRSESSPVWLKHSEYGGSVMKGSQKGNQSQMAMVSL